LQDRFITNPHLRQLFPQALHVQGELPLFPHKTVLKCASDCEFACQVLVFSGQLQNPVANGMRGWDFQVVLVL
jgi:hypothetical protein